jgi:hypothetical protein
MRHATRLLLFFAALALVLSGCGSKSVSGSGLDQSLQYVPKDAALVTVPGTPAVRASVMMSCAAATASSTEHPWLR